MNKIDILIASITNQSRILFREHIPSLHADEYKTVLKDVFKIYDSREGVFQKPPILSVQNLDFVELIYPFLHYARNIVSNKLDTLYITTTAMDEMEGLLLEKLSKLSSQTFFLEFSKITGTAFNARGFDAFFEDTDSDCIAERIKYDEFVGDFMLNRWSDFFLEYSALAILMAALTLQWISMFEKFNDALCKDYSEIRKMFLNEGSKGNITSIQAAEHNGLNMEDITLCITFDHTDKLIYKARNIDTEKCFHAFQDWISKQCEGFPLKSIRMIAGEHYGWEEYVPQRACLTGSEVKRFYIRAGMVLGLLYVFGSRDMHYNNLIANGEYPILIDLEALTGLSCDSNVLNTYFLPANFTLVDGKPEYSNALGAETVTKSIMKEIQWKFTNTDKMKPIRRNRDISPKSVVFYVDKKVYSFLYQEELLQGFECIYQYIMGHKNAVMEYIYEHFESCIARIFPRVNASYLFAVNNALAPCYLKSGADRMAIIAKTLDKTLLQHQHIPEEIIIYELEHLSVNSIPRFYITYGEGVIKEFSEGTMKELQLKVPMNTVKARINRLCGNDLEHQKTLIRKAFQDYKTNLSIHETESDYV